jgi:hypothetical protein
MSQSIPKLGQTLLADAPMALAMFSEPSEYIN